MVDVKAQAGSKAILRIKDADEVVRCCQHFQNIANERKGRLAAVIKSDGYGFGIENMVPAINKAGVEYVYTSDIDEARAIRDAGFTGKLFTLNGFFARQSREFSEIDAVPVLSSRQQMEEYQSFAKKAGVRKEAVLHFDTGMNRNGLSVEEASWAAENFSTLNQSIDIDHYLTHLHSVDLDQDSLQQESAEQIRRLTNRIEGFPQRPVSILATHGVLYIDPKQTSAFENQIYRVGVGLLGDIYENPLSVQIYARINETRTVKQGEAIGYDQIFAAPNDMRIAVVDIGYGDGYSRGLNVSNDDENHPDRPFMMIDGARCPVIGKISMNLTTVDISSLPTANPKNDFAQVIGPDVDVRTLADYAGTVPEELLIGLQSGNRRAKDVVLKKTI